MQFFFSNDIVITRMKFMEYKQYSFIIVNYGLHTLGQYLFGISCLVVLFEFHYSTKCRSGLCLWCRFKFFAKLQIKYPIARKLLFLT